MLGNRELQILRYFSMSNHELSATNLLVQLSISDRQLRYSLNKINNELSLSNRSNIKRMRDGTFLLNPDDIQWLYYKENSGYTQLNHQGDFYIQPIYRPIFLVLKLLASTDKVSLKKLQDFLNVSKNTVIQDIKNTSELITIEGLSLSYTKASGYTITGDTDSKRRLLIRYINDLVIHDVNINFLEELFVHQKSKLLKLLSRFERHFSLRFSDSSFSKLYFTFGIYERFASQQLEETIDYTYLSPLRKEVEFSFVRDLCHELQLSFSSESDFEWLTLLFLSSNTILNETQSENQKLFATVEEMVEIFEKQSGIHFTEKNLLVRKLFFHLKPAVYRLRYNVPLTDSEYYKITDSDLHNQTIYSILTTCLQPFKNYLGMDIPRSELELISYYFGSELVKISEKYEEVSHLRAGVVCSNGMVVAKIMLQTLNALFPELNFVTTCSLRDFEQYSQEFDVIFTTVPLNTNLPYYVIPSVLNQEECKNLRQHVLSDLKIDHFHQKTKDILEMVKKYADIRDLYELEAALDGIVGENIQSQLTPINNLLDRYITPSRIITKTDSLSWQESLDILGNILINQHLVTEHYMDVVMEQMGNEDSYYILGQSVAIPHASPDDGVLEDGFAVLISREPIVFPGNRAIHFIIILALLDNKNHLGALNQIMHLSRSPHIQNTLLSNIEQPNLFEYLIGIPQQN